MKAQAIGGLAAVLGLLALAGQSDAAPPADTRPVVLAALQPTAAPGVLRTRALRFVPLADGREAVFEDNSTRLVHMLPADKNQQSFLRVTIRILQVTRQHHGVDTRLPFLLEMREGAGLVLEDPPTHSTLPVRAFGLSAVAILAPMLTAPAIEIGSMPATCPRLEC